MDNNKIQETENALIDLLNENHISFDECEFNGCFFTITINWGDWKHEHGCLRNFLKSHGYHYVGAEVTEEDGSDCYSAEHYCIPL